MALLLPTSLGHSQQAASLRLSVPHSNNKSTAHHASLQTSLQTSSRGASIAMPSIAPSLASAPLPSFFEDEILDCRTPLLVDFYATWCGPCQLMSGVLSDLGPSLKKASNVRIMKVDIDEHPQLATKYRVQGLPTLVLFREGQPVDRVEGMLDKHSLGKRLRFYCLGLENKFGRR